MANWGAGLSGAGTGALAGSTFGPIGTAVGAGIGGLLGLFGGPKKPRGADPTQLLGQRYDQLMDPNYMKQDFINTARQLGPSRDDIMSRLAASGLGTGVSSILADQQYRNYEGRALGQATNAYSQFRLGQQREIDQLLGMRTGYYEGQQGRRDAFSNQLLGSAFALGGQYLGGGIGG